jgi:hypothetical protein
VGEDFKLSSFLKFSKRQIFLLAAQLLLPGTAHLFIRRIRVGILFLVGWVIILTVYGLAGRIRLVILIWAFLAIAHLLSCKEFRKTNNGKTASTRTS